MKREWTDPQKKIINNRDKNLLVSAAAGSGKTAVLVARIIKMITDPEKSVDIDKLVVITFTRAAAAQMRQKISDELEKLLEKDPENSLYRRQQRLLSGASICTIDSFCIDIVRSYFQKLELDPAFRIADETELKLIKSDCMDKLMEKYHEEGDEDFYYLIEAYCGYKSDVKLTEYIYTIANRAEAQPWPFMWLDGLEKDFDIKNGEELADSKPAMSIFYHVTDIFRSIGEKIYKAATLCLEGDGAPDYLPTIKEDLSSVADALDSADYAELGKKIQGIAFSVLSRKKSGDPEMKEKVKGIRDGYKKEIEAVKKAFFKNDADETASLISKSLPAVKCLVKMTKDYLTLLKEMKKERNVIDFSDAEHYALDILWGDTPEALELRNRYHEIIIDEYQDSNNVQEYIARSIAGDCKTRPFIFTVGDVKQSIYKFRNACPELFIDKQERYAKKEDNGEVIVLDNNFRSREEVLLSTNAVFQHVMRKELGGIEYNDECSLKKGLSSQDSQGPDSPYKTEIYLLSDTPVEDEDEEADTETGEEESETKITQEARMIASRIKKLVYEDGLLVPDEEEEGKMRPVRFSDIVVLLRTIKGWASEFAAVFEEEGIPVFSEDAEGFFKSAEVRLVVDFLSILDNPRQDIPFAAVLHSVVGGLNEEELALIKIYAREAETFYEAALRTSEAGENEGYKAISEKLCAFFRLYDSLLEFKKSSSVSELIEKIYTSTNIYTYFSAMPDGEKRKANLNMLPGYAVNFENTSYSGLFSFIRYYEKLKSNELDYGEAGAKVVGNCVRIMSIHKSKGLEFPVVFVSGMGKQFNLRDLTGDICISPQHGLGIKYVDIENRIKYPSFYHSVIAMRGREDVIGEEMRLLYVAMTRAKDKLIMTGMVGKPNESTDYASLFKAKSYMDFVYPVLNAEQEYFNIYEVSSRNIVVDPDGETKEKEGENPEVPDGSDEKAVQIIGELKDKLLKIRSAVYPYSSDEAIPVKLSVSELKHDRIEEDFGEDMFEETREFQPGDRTLPDFLKEEEKSIGGTGYGTLMHKCMQFLPMDTLDRDGVEAFLSGMVSVGRITAEEKNRIPVGKITRFLNSPIADRIRSAAGKGLFFREKQFMFAMPAKEINSEKYGESDILVPIQGVIDAIFEEDGELVILDYKTDSLSTGEEEKLVKLYRTQLDIYADAAEQLLGKKVKEKVLYSFSLDEEIWV